MTTIDVNKKETVLLIGRFFFFFLLLGMELPKSKETKLQRWNFKAGYNLAFLATIFFGIGVGIDCVKYIADQSWLLLSINIPVLLILAFSFFYLVLVKKHWNAILIINYLVLTINIIVSTWHRAYTQEIADFSVAYNMNYGIVIVATSAFILNPKWTYTYAFLFSLCYVSCALYTKSPYLMGSIEVTPALFFGTAYVTRSFIKLFINTEKRAIELEGKTTQLKEHINKEKARMQNALSLLQQKAEDANIDLSIEIGQIVKSANNNLSEEVIDFADNLNSEENQFCNRLLQIHPNLTTGELKLCFMLRKNMSTKEIAAQTLCTVDSVRVFRSRLRKKLKLERAMELTYYLKRIEIEAISA